MTANLLASRAGRRAQDARGGICDPAAVAAGLAEFLEGWREEHLSLRDPLADPMEARRYEGPPEAFHVPSYVERLTRTGRRQLAEDLERRLHADWVTRGRW